MAGFQRADGVDTDAIFAPLLSGMTPAPSVGFQRSDGVDLAGLYAPWQYGTTGPAIGFQTSQPLDIAAWFALANSTVMTPGFSGKNYTTGVSAPTGASGTVSAFTRLDINTDGTWQVWGGNSYTAAAVKESGNLYMGGPSGWEYRLYDNRGNDTGWRSSSVYGSNTANASALANSTQNNTTAVVVTFQARRAGQSAAAVTASCQINAQANGWQ